MSMPSISGLNDRCPVAGSSDPLLQRVVCILSAWVTSEARETLKTVKIRVTRAYFFRFPFAFRFGFRIFALEKTINTK